MKEQDWTKQELQEILDRVSEDRGAAEKIITALFQQRDSFAGIATKADEILNDHLKNLAELHQVILETFSSIEHRFVTTVELQVYTPLLKRIQELIQMAMVVTRGIQGDIEFGRLVRGVLLLVDKPSKGGDDVQ